MTESKGIYLPRHWTLAQRLVHYSAPNESGCRLWTADRDRKGYGRIRWRGKTILAHRAAYETWGGMIPSGLHVCHRCDVPACINVGHLFLGTNADNTADKVAKGRVGDRKGTANGRAKLTGADVLAIRADKRMHRIIAAEYGVDRVSVSMIKRRETWRHIP